jgi:cytoskeletal protein RodZ
MESVGELLKHEREAQGKTVEDVAKATKMSTLIIEALEADHFSVLPAPVYVKGHLRTYARYLGLNEDAIVDKYLRFTQQLEHEELDEWDAVELELHEEKQRIGRRWVWGAVGVAIVVIAFVAWYLSTRRGSETEEVSATPAAVTEPVRETVAEDTLIEWHKLQLLAVARERTWLSVSIDGEPVADLTLERGEERQWEADESFELDVGNGGGLELYLDGEFLGTAGSGSRLVEGLVVNEDGMSR